MPKKLFRAVYALNYVFQAGFSMVCPAGLLILGGWYLTARCGVGKWALAASIILGVLIGLYAMFRFLLKTADHIDPTEGGGDDGKA